MKRLKQMLDKIHTMKTAEGIEDIIKIDSVAVSTAIANDNFIDKSLKYGITICPKCK